MSGIKVLIPMADYGHDPSGNIYLFHKTPDIIRDQSHQSLSQTTLSITHILNAPLRNGNSIHHIHQRRIYRALRHRKRYHPSLRS